MLHGKYWIKPDGSIIDCTCDEHARIALGHMLKIEPALISIQDIFKPLAPHQRTLHLNRGISPVIVSMLSQPDHTGSIDPRVFMIRYWQWVRVRKNCFYAWQWHPGKVKHLLGSEAYWKTQTQVTDDDWVELYDVATTEVKQQTLGSLKCSLARGG